MIGQSVRHEIRQEPCNDVYDSITGGMVTGFVWNKVDQIIPAGKIELPHHTRHRVALWSILERQIFGRLHSQLEEVLD